MKIERKWAMPNKATFTIKPIKGLLLEEVGNGKNWIDPFAGDNSPAEFTNDLNPAKKASQNYDAIDWLPEMPDKTFKGILLDPPYSKRQVSEYYKAAGVKVTGWHTSAAWVSNIKDLAAKIVMVGGKAICFGWNSSGLGIKRGFKLTRILLVPHGGEHHDTIVTVEVKTREVLNEK